MEKRPTSLLTQKKKKNKDLCPVCDKNLFFDIYTTQRVGLLADDDFTIEGWMCPFCSSQFDLKNNLVFISPRNLSIGRA